MSRSQQIVWWVFVTILVAAGLLISAAETRMAAWLTARAPWIAIVAACGAIFAVFIWIASRLDE